MAQMLFPSSNWNQTVNTIDTIVVDYTSPYPSVNLTLYCEVVKGTANWIWWLLPGPLQTNGSYNLRLSSLNFRDFVNQWPTQCHLDLTNAVDGSQNLNGANIPMSTAAAGVEGKTFSLSRTTSSTATSSVTATRSSLTSSATISTVPSRTVLPTATGAIPPGGTTTASPDGLSQPAKIGIGVGVTLGVLLAVVLAAWAILFYRRRRRGLASSNVINPNKKYEKAELLGHPVAPFSEAPIPLSSPSVKPELYENRFSDTAYQGRFSPPLELPSAPYQSYMNSPGQGYTPVLRHELP